MNHLNQALTELFKEARNGDTPIMVEREVEDIDEIVRIFRFDGWQESSMTQANPRARSASDPCRSRLP